MNSLDPFGDLLYGVFCVLAAITVILCVVAACVRLAT